MRALLPLTLVLLGTAFAQTHTGHTMPMPAPTPAKPAAPASGAAPAMDHMDPWNTQGLDRLSGPAFDRAYLSMMVAHHEAALDMSRAVLARARDPQVKAWAEEVVFTQQSEVREMNAMFQDFKLGGVDAARRDAMKRAMQPMVDAVKNAKNPESAWVQHMIPHHAAGVVMATLALSQSGNDLVRQHAAGIVKVQAQQMYDYRRWAPGS